MDAAESGVGHGREQVSQGVFDDPRRSGRGGIVSEREKKTNFAVVGGWRVLGNGVERWRRESKAFIETTNRKHEVLVDLAGENKFGRITLESAIAISNAVITRWVLRLLSETQKRPIHQVGRTNCKSSVQHEEFAPTDTCS